jgi:hypothetical protein
MATSTVFELPANIDTEGIRKVAWYALYMLWICTVCKYNGRRNLVYQRHKLSCSMILVSTFGKAKRLRQKINKLMERRHAF